MIAVNKGNKKENKEEETGNKLIKDINPCC